MAAASQARPPDLAQLVRQAAHGGTDAIVALPSQRQEFWECEAVQNSLSQIASSINVNFQALGVGPSCPEDVLVAAVELAATKTLKDSRSSIVSSFSASLRPCLAQAPCDQDDINDEACEDELLWAARDVRFDSQTLSDASFGGPAVMTKLETLANVADPAAVLQKLCTSYDIVDLADSEPAMFEAGLKHILSAAVSAPSAAETHFQKAFAIITSSVDGRALHLRLALEHLLAQEHRPTRIDLSGAVYRVLSLIPESLQTDPDADPAAVAFAVAQALSECFGGNLRAGGPSPPASAAAGILAHDPTMKWWTRLLAMPHVARHVIPAAVRAGVVRLAVDSIHTRQPQHNARSPGPGTSDDHLLPAACIVLLSMMSSRSRVDAWLQAIQSSPDQHVELEHGDGLQSQEIKPARDTGLCPVTRAGHAPGHAVLKDTVKWMDTASRPIVEANTPADVMPVLLEYMARLQDTVWQATQLQTMFRSLCVAASLLPELMHSLDATLSLLLRCHLDLLSGCSFDGASRPTQHTHAVSPISGACVTAPSTVRDARSCDGVGALSLRPPPADGGGRTGPQGVPGRSAVSEEWCAAPAERMCGFARVVATLCGTGTGCDMIFTATDCDGDGGPSWPSALAAWLRELPAVAPLESPPIATVLTSWLATVCSIACRPHVCTYNLLPVFKAIPALIDTLAQAAGFSRSGSVSTGGACGVIESVCGVLEQISALVADAPLAAAMILTDRCLSPRASALLISYLMHALAAGVAAVVRPRPTQPTSTDAQARRSGGAAAASALRAMAALQRSPAQQRALVAAGVDAVLVRGLLCAPRCRCGDDDDVLLSGATATAVRLLRERMRWSGAAAVAAAAGPAASMDEPRSALIAVLKAISLGSDGRLSDLCAFEDRRLVLACLLQPWLRGEASYTLVASFIPDPLALIRSACTTALGLPVGTTLPVGPPGAQNRPCAHALTCGHRSPHAAGDDAAAADGDGSAGADRRMLTAAVSHLPLGLQYSADRRCCAAIRMATGAEAPSADERDHKRVRLQERHGAEAPSRLSGDTARASAGANEGPVGAVAAVAMAEPGMQAKHVWWRTAAAALAALFTDPDGPCRGVAAQCEAASVVLMDGGGCIAGRTSGSVLGELGRGGARGFGRRSGAGSSAGWAGLGACGHDVALVLQRVLQAPSGAEFAADTGTLLADVKLPASHSRSLLTSEHMRLLAVQPDPAVSCAPHPPSMSAAVLPPKAPGFQLPPLLPADSSGLTPWILQAEEVLCSMGMPVAVCSAVEGAATAPARATKSQRAQAGASATVVSLARVQQAASVACGHHRTGSALPDADTFVLLMFALHGGSVGQLPAALAAAAAAPVGRFVWPAYAAAMHGPAPLLQLAASARILLAQEDRALFAALEGAHLVNEILLRWLQELLLPVLPVPAAAAVVALTLVHGPLVLAATAVALLHVLRPVALQKAGAGDLDELREWLLAVHCFDADSPEVLSHALAMEARHRHKLLPLLLDPSCAR